MKWLAAIRADVLAAPRIITDIVFGRHRTTGPVGESEWRYDNREQAHMQSCQMCNPNGAQG